MRYTSVEKAKKRNRVFNEIKSNCTKKSIKNA